MAASNCATSHVSYVKGQQGVKYTDDLVGNLFFYRRRGTGDFVLVKVYRKNGGKPGFESVAVMDAATNEHLGYPSVNSLYKAEKEKQSVEEQVAEFLKGLNL